MSNRTQVIDRLTSESFDLLVIGGGATGCGIALDAASRGLKVALVEKGDFASGTSSKSTKLIHGGLRYLKQLDVALVRETGTERAVVNKIAAHLCLPEKMLLPITKNGTYGKLSSSIGLFVYDFLAGVENEDRRQMLNRKQTLKKEPLLDKKQIIGGGYYAEYRTDDARLTIELIKKATQFGAVALNYCEMKKFRYTDDKIDGVVCKNIINGKKFEVRAAQVVSATGPWVDHLRKLNDSIEDKRLRLTKGVHLVFPHEKFPVQQSIYFDEPGGRMLFAIPRGKVTYLGTTDTEYNGNMDRIVCTKSDRNYLLDAVNATFPGLNLSKKDIISNWMGLRPLIHEQGKAPSELSRKDEIFQAEDGLISIAGGKLTGYRKMAERVVDLVIKKGSIKPKKRKSITKELALGGDKAMSNKKVKKYIDQLSKKLESKGIDPYFGWYLATNYGKQSEEIIKDLSSESNEIELVESEIKFCIRNEMVVRAADFFVRRTGRLYFDPGSIHRIRDKVFEILTKELNWSQKRVEEENEILDELIYDATHYYENELK